MALVLSVCVHQFLHWLFAGGAVLGFALSGELNLAKKKSVELESWKYPWHKRTQGFLPLS